MELEFDDFFNATILIAWAGWFIPYALREKRFALLGLSGAIMLIAEVIISMHFAHREFPFNFLAGVFIFTLGLCFGFAVYFFESKNHEEEP